MSAIPYLESTLSRLNLSKQWLPLLLSINVAVQAFLFLYLHMILKIDINPDSAMFHLGGLVMTQGGIPYVDFWDIKPPFIYFVTFLQSQFCVTTFGSCRPNLLFMIGGISAGILMTICSTCIGYLVFILYDDGFAAFIAGVSIYIIPQLYILPAQGLRPKYFTLLFGLTAIISVLHRKPLCAGISAGLASGFYQGGVIFLCLVIFVEYRLRSTRNLAKPLAGCFLVLAFALVPFVYWQAIETLAIQTVVIPLLVDVKNTSAINHTLGIIASMGYGILAIGVGALGWKETAVCKEKTEWILYGAISFLAYNIFLDFDGNVDLIFFVAFVSLGIGSLVASSAGYEKLFYVAIVLFCIAMMFVWWKFSNPPLSWVFDPVRDQAVAGGVYEQVPNQFPSIRERYWTRTVRDTCHWRLSPTEISWIEMTDDNYYQQSCRYSVIEFYNKWR